MPFAHFLGYSNEIGESFRPLVAKSFVAASYGMAIGYVCTDTFDKALRLQMDGASSREVAIKGGDVFAWQMLASVAIPGLVINRWVHPLSKDHHTSPTMVRSRE